MSKTLAAHEPINYLDSILNEEEKRCEYSHQWRNFTISRSGRFKSKNKHRNIVDGKMFDRTSSSSSSCTSNSVSSAAASSPTSGPMTSSSYSKLSSYYDKDKISSHNYGSSSSTKSYQNPQMQTATKTISSSPFGTPTSNNNNWQRDKVESYKSYYETNL